MAVVAQSPEMVNTVPGRTLTEPDWLSARIAEMGRSWGATEPRVSGTLWWCMVASALVEQLARAYANEEPAPEPFLDRLDCEVRPDGGIERVLIHPVAGAGVGHGLDGDSGAAHESDPALGHACAKALRETLAAVIGPVATVSGAGVPSLWAIAADAIGNRALDAGNSEAGARLAGEVGGKLPVPRFVDVDGRTFVRRISCCLVFEVPGCEMCTSCPKRPAAERKALLARLAAES
ncbi:(2Fe-2S)-binding protein [Nocardia vinacea]|uniref:(2Fe-2S)-binding protein n=1 Tax=Nocardia vinacea TaxID=96468 RepID=A0ABZ1YV45_9NOCA|nr:(2Fe-2S)-binding protein [Nocardia vinacea]